MQTPIDSPPPTPTATPTATGAAARRPGRRWLLGARGLAGLCLLATLGACGTPATRLAVYDFGPGTTTTTTSVAPAGTARLPPLLLAEVEAPAALDGSAVLYRLLYADAQQLRPYAQARWSMPPAQLLRQRLREVLGQRRSVLAPLDALVPGTLVLRLELEECSQLFDTAHSSHALLRVRATLGRSGNPAKPLGQTVLVVQTPSASADAAGGVRALAEGADVLLQQLDAWLQQVAATEAAP